VPIRGKYGRDGGYGFGTEKKKRVNSQSLSWNLRTTSFKSRLLTQLREYHPSDTTGAIAA